MEDSGSFDLGSNPGGVTLSLYIINIQAFIFFEPHRSTGKQQLSDTIKDYFNIIFWNKIAYTPFYVVNLILIYLIYYE